MSASRASATAAMRVWPMLAAHPSARLDVFMAYVQPPRLACATRALPGPTAQSAIPHWTRMRGEFIVSLTELQFSLSHYVPLQLSICQLPSGPLRGVTAMARRLRMPPRLQRNRRAVQPRLRPGL